MNDNHPSHVAEWQRARFAPPPEPTLSPTAPTSVHRVTMRDGVKLYTEVFLPKATRRGPVIFCRSPYPFSRPSRHDPLPLCRYLDAGYAYVFQMTRGQYRSEGEFHWHQTDREDGFDSIAWIAGQPWCDGNVGMEGASYCGKVQLQAAHARPPALKCIMPSAHVSNFVQCYPFMGGVPARTWWLQLHELLDAESPADATAPYGDRSILRHPVWGPAIRKRPMIEAPETVLNGSKRASWVETMSHPLDDDFWRPAHFSDEEMAALDVPVFFTGGWYDQTVGPVADFVRLERLQPERNDRYLLVGPWNHYQTGSSLAHDRDVGARVVPPNSAVDFVDLRNRFFDRYLRREASVAVQTDKARVFITGLDEWRGFSTFPPPNSQQRRCYLHSDGDADRYPNRASLAWDAPTDDGVHDTYRYDPRLPTPSPPASLAEPVQDLRDIEIRGDVLTYTSETFDKPLTLVGNIELVLYAASDCRDTDWFATVTEVFPNGQSIPFHCAIGALRARYRDGFDQEAFLTPNVPTRFRIPLGAAGHRLAPASRLRLSLCSARFPACEPNTNTGNPALTDTDARVATQSVFHDSARPSHLLLPVYEDN